MNTNLNLDTQPDEELDSDSTGTSFSKMSILNNDQSFEQQYKELFKEKQQYQALFDLAPICYILLDRKGRIKNANINSMELLEASRKQLLDKKFYSFLGVDERAKFKAHLKDAFNTVERVVLGIFFDSKAGKRYLELHSSRFNENLALLAIIDKTDKWEAENKIQDMLEKVKESEALKSAFLANVSHEIRTPVNAILGFSHILGDNINNDHNKELLKIINDSSQNLLAIFDNIIELSKIVSGHIKLQNSPMALNSLLLGVYKKKMSACAPEENTTLNLRLDIYLHSNDFVVNADQEKLERITTLLLDNALKYTKEGIIQINCEKIKVDGKDYIKFYFKDTGIGISKNKVNIIFNPFRQADDSLSRRYEGAGIGLSICKGMVEMMGGEIDVVSHLGKGSVFSFSIPYETINMPELFIDDLKIDKHLLVLGKIDDHLVNICEGLWASEARISFLNTIEGYVAQRSDKQIDAVLIRQDDKEGKLNFNTIDRIKTLFPNAKIGVYTNDEQIKIKNIDCSFVVSPATSANELAHNFKTIFAK